MQDRFSIIIENRFFIIIIIILGGQKIHCNDRFNQLIVKGSLLRCLRDRYRGSMVVVSQIEVVINRIMDIIAIRKVIKTKIIVIIIIRMVDQILVTTKVKNIIIGSMVIIFKEMFAIIN